MLEGTGDEEDVSGVGVVVAHEVLDAGARGAFVVAEARGDGGLDVGGEDLERAVGDVVELVAGAEEEVVGGVELAALGGAEEVVVLEVLEGAGALVEEGHPEEVLEVAEAADAVLDVGFLEGRGVAVLEAAGALVLESLLDVLVRVALDAFLAEAGLELAEEAFVAGDEAGLEEGGLDLHVAVGLADAVLDGAGDVAQLEAEVPEGIEEAADAVAEALAWGGRRGGHLVVQEHEVEVRHGAQLAASEAAMGDEGHPWGVLAGGVEPEHGVPEVAQEEVHDQGAGVAGLDAAAAGAMEHAEPEGLDLEVSAVPWDLVGRATQRREHEA